METTFVAIDPATRCTIRVATAEEVAAYLAQPLARPHLPRNAVLVGEVLIDEDTGPGIWFGGAGF